MSELKSMRWAVISAVNDEHVLKTSLLESPDLRSANDVILQRGYVSAASAYNVAIRKASSDLLVFVHQDVYLPERWIDNVRQAIDTLSVHDPNWGVLGVWGAVDSRERVGYLYWTGDYGWERPFDGVKEVVSLDEVVLIFRKSSGLMFDEKLPGYHMYGADICAEARRRGSKSYAISAFCIHNTNIGGLLPLEFWKSYLYMRRKWKHTLPIDTPCTRISFWCWPILRWNLMYARNIALGRQRKLQRAEDPAAIYRALVALGRVQRV
jgi:GT2 family glycosyltransferase